MFSLEFFFPHFVLLCCKTAVLEIKSGPSFLVTLGEASSGSLAIDCPAVYSIFTLKCTSQPLNQPLLRTIILILQCPNYVFTVSFLSGPVLRGCSIKNGHHCRPFPDRRCRHPRVLSSCVAVNPLEGVVQDDEVYFAGSLHFHPPFNQRGEMRFFSIADCRLPILRGALNAQLTLRGVTTTAVPDSIVLGTWYFRWLRL